MTVECDMDGGVGRLTVDTYISLVIVGSSEEVSRSVELMLRQLYSILVECISQPTEIISRLGCSCIR